VIAEITAEYTALLKETPTPSVLKLDSLLQSSKCRLAKVWNEIVKECETLSTLPGGRKEGEPEAMFHLRLLQYAEMVWLPAIVLGAKTEEEVKNAVSTMLHELWNDWYDTKTEEAEAECDSPGWIQWKTFDVDVADAWWENDATTDWDWKDSYSSQLLANYNAIHGTDLAPVLGDPVPVCEGRKALTSWLASLRTKIPDDAIVTTEMRRDDVDDGVTCEFFLTVTNALRKGETLETALTHWTA